MMSSSIPDVMDLLFSMSDMSDMSDMSEMEMFAAQLWVKYGEVNVQLPSLREATFPLALIRQGHWAQPHLAGHESRGEQRWLGTG